jgi:hypothetical protein
VRDIQGKSPRDGLKHFINKSDPPAHDPRFRRNAVEPGCVPRWTGTGKEAVILALDYPGRGVTEGRQKSFGGLT